MDKRLKYQLEHLKRKMEGLVDAPPTPVTEEDANNAFDTFKQLQKRETGFKDFIEDTEKKKSS